jgi:hypothetical protein
MALIIPDGKATGCLPRQSRFGQRCPIFREEIDVIPRVEWGEWIGRITLRPFVKVIFDQNGEGSCAAESANGGLQVVRAWEGQTHVTFNPWFTYYHTKIGGGGSTLDDNLVHLRDVGACPMTVWPRSRGVSRPSAEAYQAALNYRMDEFFDIDSQEECGTALLLGMPVVFGWQGHSCFMTKLIDEQTAEYANSWAPSWGDEGFGQVRLSAVNFSYGMFAYRTARRLT